MPEDPKQNPMFAEYESSVPGDPVAAEKARIEQEKSQAQMKGPPTFWDAIARSGLDMRPDGDMEQIAPSGANMAKLAGTALAGSPGGPVSSAFNLFQSLIAPSTVPPVRGLGNFAEAASGLLPQALRTIPWLAKMGKAAPKTAAAASGAASGALNAGANAFDRGGEVKTDSKIGAAVGVPLGLFGEKMHRMTNSLPSSTALDIDKKLAKYSNAPADTVAQNKKAMSLLSALSESPSEHRAMQAAQQDAGLQNTLRGVFSGIADKFRPSVKGAMTTAEEATARFKNAGDLTKIAGTSDIDAAKDFLRIDYRKNLFALGQEKMDLDAKYTGNTRNLPFYKAKANALDSRIADLETQAAQATELTRRTEAAAAKAESGTINAEAVGGDMAKNARAAQMLSGKQQTKLSGMEGASNAAEKAAIAKTVEADAAQQRFTKIFDDAKLSPTDITSETQNYLNYIAPKQGTLTIKEAVEAAVSDETRAKGLRHLLEKKDPEMLRSAQAELLFNVFEASRTGKGGKGQFPQVFNGDQLSARVEKMDTHAVNALFNDDKAHATLREIANSAKEADKLASIHKIAGGIGSIGMTATGYAVMHSLGRTVTEPTTMLALTAAAGAGYFALNVPRFVEANIQTDGAIGRMLTQYIKSPNPDKLPAAVIAALSKIGARVAYPPKGRQSGPKRPPVDIY